MSTLELPHHRLDTLSRAALWILAGAIVAWLAGAAIALTATRLADAEAGKIMIVFPPDRTAEQKFRAIIKAGGRPLRPVMGGLAWIASGDEPGFVGRLRRQGALAAYGELPFGPALAGCFAYVPRNWRTSGPTLVR